MEEDDPVFSYGKLEHPADNDPRFSSLENAESAAVQASIHDSIYGVWYDPDGELLAIVYQGTAFRP